MATPPANNPASPAETPSLQRFLTRAETVTLLGMLLTIFSLFLTWERVNLAALGVPTSAIVGGDLTRKGQATGAFWPMTVCALLSGAALLFAPTPKTRLPIALIQGAGAIACFLIAFRWLAPLPGVVLGFVGSALLVFGAIDRYTQSAPRPQP